MLSAKRIIIVGGGIGGAATALALHRAGFEPVVYERTIDRNFTTWRGLTDYIPSGYRPGYIREFLGAGKGFGFMMLGKGRMYWYAAAKAPEGQPDAAIGRFRQLEEMFLNWFPSILELIAATNESDIIKTDLYDRLPTRPWGKHNITLLGDAAHPTLPTLGQGACMALEDALVVTKCLLAQSDFVAAFKQYEYERFPRAKSIVEQSLQSGRMGELQNPIAVALRNTFMKLMGKAIENSFKTLHAYRA